MTVKRTVGWACLVVVLWLGWDLGAVGAQGNRARLIVTVTDQTGGVLPGADVKIVGLENATRAAVAPLKATAAGVATFEGVVLGRYSLEAEFPGFTKGVLKETRVRAGDNRLTIALALRTMTDEVTVGQDRQEAAADRGVSFGTALTREQIDALSDDPNELRQQLMDMAGPGSVISVDSFEGGQLPPKSQIRSIRIARDQFAAENHNPGIGRIEVVTQPGIGPMRGNIQSNFYDSSMDGRNPLIGRRADSRSSGIGGGLSGTLIKERLSFNVFGNTSSSFSTPILTTGAVARSASLRTPSDSSYVYGMADYALTRDQTVRMNVSRNTFSNENQGVGVYDEVERAFSTSNANTSVYLQQTGPLGRRFALNSRLSLNLSDQTSASVFEGATMTVLDRFTLGGAQRTGGTKSQAWQLASDLDYVRSIHSVRIGVMADIFRFRSDANSNYFGTYTFESEEAYLAGRPRSYTRRIGDPNIRYNSTQVGFYVQDDIRVRRNLSLSPGLRYEAQSHVAGKWNFGPRFGFTWAPTASARTSIRGSIGVFYDWLPNFTYQQTLQVDGFRQQEVNLINPSYPDPGPVGSAAPTNRYLLSDSLELPRTTRVSAGVTQTFSPRFSVGVLYTDLWGQRLLVGRNLNAPVGGVRPDRAFANVIEAVPGGRSRQRSVNANVNLNLAQLSMVPPTGGPLFDWRRGLRVGSSYTLGSARNDTDGAFSTPATGDLTADWGPSNQDVRHRVSFNVGTQAVRGLSVQLSVNGASANPLTIRTGLDDNGDLIFNDRPAGVGRNTARTKGFWNSQMFLGYSIPIGTRTVNTGPGVAIVSQGGGLVVNQLGAQNTARYRLVISVNAQNVFNVANYTGYSGVMTSSNFLKPSSVQGVRRINFNVGLTF